MYWRTVMEKYYKVSDVGQFLFEQNIWWRPEPINRDKVVFGTSFQAEIMFLSEDIWRRVHLQINEIDFKIFKGNCETRQDPTYPKELMKDLSSDWVKFLIKKYPEIAWIIKRIIATKMKKIHENAKVEIKPLQKKIKKIKQEEQAEMNNLRELDDLVGEEFNSIK